MFKIPLQAVSNENNQLYLPININIFILTDNHHIWNSHKSIENLTNAIDSCFQESSLYLLKKSLLFSIKSENDIKDRQLHF